MRVLDGANLELSATTAADRIDAGTVFVADDDNRIVGALVAISRDEGAHVEAVAVRRKRRASGIGSALVEAAADRWTPLTADFDPPVKPFYDSLGFDIEQNGDRYRGVRD
nr:GNAT family N-acetyltransferase [Halobacterium wangiae]